MSNRSLELEVSKSRNEESQAEQSRCVLQSARKRTGGGSTNLSRKIDELISSMVVGVVVLKQAAAQTKATVAQGRGERGTVAPSITHHAAAPLLSAHSWKFVL